MLTQLLRRATVLTVVTSMAASLPVYAAEFEQLASKASEYRGKTPVAPQPDGSILIEAEEFGSGDKNEKGWQAKNWGENYYAATFAITFLSRKAFLGAPEQADKTVATIEVEVPKAGRYLALARYEAAYRFETQFSIKIEQGGKTRLDRLYGARKNLKVWPFSSGIKDEVGWYWGAVENTVWEGHDVFVDLEPGLAKITLTADRQPEPAAKRNVDAILLTTDVAGVTNRIQKEGYLPLDGLLTQAGDVFARVQNRADNAVTITVPSGIEHSPYWVHIRQWKPQAIAAQPGATSDWVEVGSVLDTMNDGLWSLKAAPGKPDGLLNYAVEMGVRDANGKIESIAKFDDTKASLHLVYDGNTRYSKRVRRVQTVLTDLMSYLDNNPVPGSPPSKSIIYCYTFAPIEGEASYNARIDDFRKMFGLNSRLDGAASVNGKASGYIDVRGSMAPVELNAALDKFVAAGTAASIRTVSLGDEIGLPVPGANAHDAFRTFVKSYNLKPEDLVASAGLNWDSILYSPDEKTAQANPKLFYYSRLFAQSYGINALKTVTDTVKSKLPNADTGANFSPHHGAAYLGEAHKYITLFRRGGMTMPWGEDYIWQIPIGTQQMNSLQIDMFRAGNRYEPGRDIHFYVMPHWPGNTVNSWRRMFYSSLGHGATIINLFEFQPVQVAYTENHVSLPEMFLAVRRGFNEYATFEDVVQNGQVRWGNAALWYSAAGDVWGAHRAPFGAEKRSLYIAARHQQLQIDVVDDEDAIKGTLKGYRVLYLADQNVSSAASKAIAEWVNAGGRLFATAGAGMYDEYNQPNTTMQKLFGVKYSKVVNDNDKFSIRFEKQDLPFAPTLTSVVWKSPDGEKTLPVFGAYSEFAADGSDIIATFTDGKPAVTHRKVGKGQATFCGFPVALSYFKPAIPLRPVDRGSTDDAMAHLIPTAFDPSAFAIIGGIAEGVDRPVVCSEHLVESSIIESKDGIVIPLVNWSGKPVKDLTVTYTGKAPKKVTLSSGGKVSAKSEGGRTVFILDMDVADALILRP